MTNFVYFISYYLLHIYVCVCVISYYSIAYLALIISITYMFLLNPIKFYAEYISVITPRSSDFGKT